MTMNLQKVKVGRMLRLLVCFGLAGFITMPGGFVAAVGTGSISGLITDGAGKPLRAAVVAASLGNMSVSRFSDAAGRYQISDLKPGTYKISATAWGYGSKTG